MKRSSSLLVIIIALLLVTTAIIALTPRIPLPEGGGHWGLGLTEEYSPPEILYQATLTLNKGSVWEVSYDANGLYLAQRSSQLIESLNLTADISVNDVIAPHLYDLVTGYNGANYIEWQYSSELWSANSSFYVDTVFTPLEYVPVAYPKILCLTSSEGHIFTVHHDAKGGLWTGVPGRSMGFAGQWDETARYVFEYSYVNSTTITYTAYKNGTQVTSYSASGYDYGPSSFLIGWSCYSPMVRVSFIAIYTGAPPEIPSSVSSAQVLDQANLKILVDPTFFNGTAYLDMKNNVWGSVTGIITRIPAEQQWLWLVKSLTSDNKLHLKFVPPGCTFRIYYNGRIYEWTIDGEPNAAGLIEDYAIDLASIFGQTTLPQVRVELVYPSQVVRFYVPSGLQVKIEGNGWSETHIVPLNASYVDFSIPVAGSYTVQILGYRDTPQVSVQEVGNSLRFIVTDSSGYAIPNAKIVITAGSSTIFSGKTNDLGYVDVDKSLIAGYSQLSVSVTAVKDGTYFNAQKIVTIETTGEVSVQDTSAEQVQAATEGSSSIKLIALTLALVLVLVVLIVRR